MYAALLIALSLILMLLGGFSLVLAAHTVAHAANTDNPTPARRLYLFLTGLLLVITGFFFVLSVYVPAWLKS